MNLLQEAVVHLRTSEGTRLSSLPGLLAALATEDVIDLPALRPHQSHAAYATLVQIAACALRHLQEPLPATEARWRSLLLDLSEGDADAWSLVVEDPRRPAFLQPPAPEGDLAGNVRRCTTPDQIDVPVTAKNHDLKIARLDPTDAEAWLWALVSVQTTDGYPGRGYYGVFRMNGGFGNRAAVAFVPSRAIGARFRHDVAVLRKKHDEVADGNEFDRDGVRLLWLAPWDGTSSYGLNELDPWCVEIARRIRLVDTGHGIHALIRSTTAPRCDGAARKGHVGDPWLPVQARDGEYVALTVGPNGFGYRRVAELLDPAKWRGLLLNPPRNAAGHLMLATLVRGQGKTEGWHERWVDIDARTATLLAEEEARQRLVERARARIATTDLVERKCLYPALCALHGDADERVSRGVARMDQAVDAEFFPSLWESAAQDDITAERSWAERLRALGLATLEAEIAEASLPAQRRYRAIANAENTFKGSIYNQLLKESAP